MKLPIEPPFPPMEALSVDRIPAGEEWQYEPKWDGFRCLVFRDGDDVYLQSKSRPLARYFPEVVRPKAERIGSLIQDTAARAYRNGVRIAFGTDMGVGPHGDNAREFIYMVEAGIPAATALQAATVRAAEVLGVDDQGVIEAGKRADVIAMPGNPVEDINAVLGVDFVMKDGTIHAAPGS